MTRRHYHQYTPFQLHFLRTLGHHPREKLVKWFNLIFNTAISQKALNQKCRKLGIRAQNTGCFKKGLIPWNKGTRGLMPKPKNSFQKGHLSAKTRPIGSTRLNQDGNIEVKVAHPNRWEYQSHLVWQEHFGPIPAGYIVWHRNGISDDDRIENLALVTRGELVILNRLRHTQRPDELKPSIELYARLKYQIGVKTRDTAQQ